MPLYDFNCKDCGSEITDIICPSREIEKYRPMCCGKSMRTKISTFAMKVWNYDRATQTGEENARMCGVDI